MKRAHDEEEQPDNLPGLEQYRDTAEGGARMPAQLTLQRNLHLTVIRAAHDKPYHRMLASLLIPSCFSAQASLGFHSGLVMGVSSAAAPHAQTGGTWRGWG